ncbi:hypothetical protein D9M69_514890 [compost metagenome]
MCLVSASQRSVCSREASRTSTTRMSCANASSILRSASTCSWRACASFFDGVAASTSGRLPAMAPMRSSCRTPLTSRATSSPKRGSISASVSGTNAASPNRQAAARAASSTRRPSRMRSIPSACDCTVSPVGSATPAPCSRTYASARPTSSASGMPATRPARSVDVTMSLRLHQLSAAVTTTSIR